MYLKYDLQTVTNKLLKLVVVNETSLFFLNIPTHTYISKVHGRKYWIPHDIYNI